MKKIISAKQSRELDAYTIEHEPISSVDLMERASTVFARKIMEKWDAYVRVFVFAGPGNNGGDALAVSRLLGSAGYDVHTFLFAPSGRLSSDCETNLERLKGCQNVALVQLKSLSELPVLTRDDLIIDGLFGTGLSRPLSDEYASVVKYINTSPSTVVSIDMPSGLMCETNAGNVMENVVNADYTYTFQFPKLSMFFPENEKYVGCFEVLYIGVCDPCTEISSTPYQMVEMEDVASLLCGRSRFAHKGSMGHAVLVAGQKGMAGAAILASKACLKTGVGKVTVRTPEYNVVPLQISVPEAVLSIDPDEMCFSQSFDMKPYHAIALGPGMGKDSKTVQAFAEQFESIRIPAVLDADAINVLADHKGWIRKMPKNCILTPHKKELAGLIGTTSDSYEQLVKTRDFCTQYQVYVVIKGAFSAVCCPDGHVYFNSTGNPGMATAGSGDVLTGVILSLLAQGYEQKIAVVLGVYLHGLAGDVAAERHGYEGLLASDIIEGLPKAFQILRSKKEDLIYG